MSAQAILRLHVCTAAWLFGYVVFHLFSVRPAVRGADAYAEHAPLGVLPVLLQFLALVPALLTHVYASVRVGRLDQERPRRKPPVYGMTALVAMAFTCVHVFHVWAFRVVTALHDPFSRYAHVQAVLDHAAASLGYVFGWTACCFYFVDVARLHLRGLDVRFRRRGTSAVAVLVAVVWGAGFDVLSHFVTGEALSETLGFAP